MDSIPIHHPRRLDRDMPDVQQQFDVLRRGQWLTLAMCHNDEPYLVTLNYTFSEPERCFYVHSATEGKKLEILRTNPRVWGQVMEDHGYAPGKATHYYRSVMFQGRAEFVEDWQVKRHALASMLDHFESDSEPLKARMLANLKSESIVVLRLTIEAISGKQNPGPSQRSRP